MDDKDDTVRNLARDRLTWEQIAFAFALAGPYAASTDQEEARIGPNTVLSLLRCLLTSRIVLIDPERTASLTHSIDSCAENFLKELTDDPLLRSAWRKGKTQETNLPELKARAETEFAKNLFFGVGDTINYLLTSLTSLHIGQGSAELYATSAQKSSQEMLADHRRSDGFQNWLTQFGALKNSKLNFVSGTEFDLLDYFLKGSEWQFWYKWYTNVLLGKPLAGELQYRIALIPEADWQLGPEHIAKCIEEIRARFELEQEIAKLKEENARLAAKSRFEIGANGGPELDDEAGRVVQEIIWAPIEALEAETKKDEPDKRTIQRQIEILQSGLKWLGSAAGAAAVGNVVNVIWKNPAVLVEWIAPILEAAQRWLAALM